jgi:tetraacyldisaccharide 4'-kinase
VGWLEGLQAVAWAGIGVPERFFAMLETLGAEVAQSVPFRDHQHLGQSDALHLLEVARRHRATLVTTEKDMARLARATGALAELAAASRVFAVELSFAEADAERLSTLVDAALKAKAG